MKHLHTVALRHQPDGLADENDPEQPLKQSFAQVLGHTLSDTIQWDVLEDQGPGPHQQPDHSDDE